jgi:exonuclease SbcD
MGVIRILFLADTHLGFDYPFKPRTARRRRGPDFFRNYEKALEPATRGEVDLVVHGGDIFYRSKIPARLVDMAFAPLKRIADSGVGVYVVPGNHERSNIPYYILAAHPNIFVFDEPRSYIRSINDTKLSLAGFPFIRYGIRERFRSIIERTGWQKARADFHILCMHQSVDGAVTGPAGFTFRDRGDVIDVHEIPSGFAVVLTGHMHRYQVLQSDLGGREIPVPVLYAGATERTSFAEKDETKGYVTVELELNKKVRWYFHELPTREMISLKIDVTEMSGRCFVSWLDKEIKTTPADAIVKINLHGKLNADVLRSIRAESLRPMVPKTMNITIVFSDYQRYGKTTATS